MATEDYSAVRFFTTFEDFATSPLPHSLDAYRAYRGRASDFIEARNRRIDGYIASIRSGSRIAGGVIGALPIAACGQPDEHGTVERVASKFRPEV